MISCKRKTTGSYSEDQVAVARQVERGPSLDLGMHVLSELLYWWISGCQLPSPDILFITLLVNMMMIIYSETESRCIYQFKSPASFAIMYLLLTQVNMMMICSWFTYDKMIKLVFDLFYQFAALWVRPAEINAGLRWTPLKLRWTLNFLGRHTCLGDGTLPGSRSQLKVACGPPDGTMDMNWWL